MDRFGRGCSVLLLCMVVAACDDLTAQEHTANGRARLSEGEIRTAVIELKNALQKDPQHAEARMLLGEAHLRLGDFASAEKEFERALDLGFDDDRVRLGLLQSKVRLGRHQEVIGELEDRGALAPEFAVVLADAYLNGGDRERARALYRQGEKLAGGRLGLGIVAWQEGDLERAAEHLAEAVRLDPGSFEAWLRKGELALARSAFDEAEAAFAEATGLPGSAVMGRVGLTRVALARGDVEAAAGELAELLRVAPNFAGANYLDGLVRFEQQDLEGAEAAIRKVQSTAPDHAPSLYLMGAIKYRQGQYAQAEDNLQRFLAQDPRNESAAKLLAAVRFDQGDHAGAVEVLEPHLPATGDPQLLAMYGTAQMALGDPAEAARTLERAVELAPDMAPFRNQLALSLLASGDSSGAEAELESAIEVDGEQFQSDYLLAMLHIRERNWDAARVAVDSLVEKHPDNPIGYNLRGALALANEDPAEARAAFERALEVDPAFLPAVRNLARVSEAGGDRDEAAKLYQSFLEDHPGHEGALLALADLALRSGDAASATTHLEQSFDANPGSLQSGLGLARLYLASGRVEDSARVVARALESFPSSPDLLLLDAEIDLRSGDVDGASKVATTLQSQVRDGSGNVNLLLALGRLQARVGQTALARANLERTLASEGAHRAAALQSLARLDLGSRQLDEARARVEELKSLAPEHPETQLIEADLLLAEDQRDAARALYEPLAEAGVRDAVMRLATLEMAEQELRQAVTRLDEWIDRNPEDLGARLLAADVVMRFDQDQALSRYEGLVESGNPVALNNLAWLYHQKGDDRALAMARRAVEAAPDNAAILDTLGWVLLNQGGDVQEAVRMLKRSVQLNPDDPSVRYHLGVALRDTGDREGARKAFSAALEAEAFPEADDAREALATL